MRSRVFYAVMCVSTAVLTKLLNGLANANQRGDWRIYAELAQAMIRSAHFLYAVEYLGAGVRQHRLRA